MKHLHFFCYGYEKDGREILEFSEVLSHDMFSDPSKGKKIDMPISLQANVYDSIGEEVAYTNENIDTYKFLEDIFEQDYDK